jgi:hypothetical protein
MSDSLYDKSFIPRMLVPKFKKDSRSFIKPNKVCSSTTGYVVHPKVFFKYLKAPPPYRRLIQQLKDPSAHHVQTFYHVHLKPFKLYTWEGLPQGLS